MTATATAPMPAWASREEFAALALILPSGRRAPQPPKAAVELVDTARVSTGRAAGWKTLLQWGEDSVGDPFLSVQVGIVEPFHHFRLCWHSRGQLDPVSPERQFVRDVSHARLRLFSQLLTTVGADSPTGDVPSLKAIRQTIAAHRAAPVTELGCPPPATPATEGGTR